MTAVFLMLLNQMITEAMAIFVDQNNLVIFEIQMLFGRDV